MGWGSKLLRGFGFQFPNDTHRNEFRKDKPRDGSGFDKDEMNLAYGLSLSEQHQLAARQTDTQRGNGSIAISHTEQDQLVTETQIETGNLNLKSPSCHLVGYGLQSTEKQIVEYEILDMNSPPCTCAGCNLRIEHGTCVRRSASLWHPECFKCRSCKKAITDDFKFSKSKRQLYHKSCYKVRRSPCFVCKDPLPPNAAGRFPHREHHFWGEKYCPSHEVDGTAVCSGCERMEQKDVKYLKLEDGRTLCLECLESATMDTDESQSVYFDVREFFEGLHMKIEQDFPLYLVEKQALNNARQEGKQGYSDVVQTRGLCLSDAPLPVSTVLKGPRRIGDKVVKETVWLVGKYVVTAILILYGLPRLLTGSILAHELMHAWFKLNGYENLKQDVEEGICQVLAHMWLESETFAADDPASASSSSSSSSPTDTSKKGKQPDFEKKLVELFKKQIEMDPSTEYGDGFRKAIKAVTKYGLTQTLKYIKANNDFP